MTDLQQAIDRLTENLTDSDLSNMTMVESADLRLILAALPQDDGWREVAVEAVPVGRSVLVWSDQLEGTFGVVVAAYQPDGTWHSDEVSFEPFEEPDYDGDDEDATITVDPSPTHWRPLPDPPQPKSETGE